MLGVGFIRPSSGNASGLALEHPTTHRQRILVLLLIVQDLITPTRPSRLCTASGIRSDLCPVLAVAGAGSSPALLGAGDFPTQAGQSLTNSPVFSASSTARSRRCGVRPSRLEPTACWRRTSPLQASKQLGRVFRGFHGRTDPVPAGAFPSPRSSWGGLSVLPLCPKNWAQTWRVSHGNSLSVLALSPKNVCLHQVKDTHSRVLRAR